MQNLRNKAYGWLRGSESFFKTDMVYLAKGGFWLTLMQIFTSLSSFALAIIFARYVEKEVYGNYKYILSLAGLAATFTLTGLPAGIVQAVARKFYGTFIYAVKISFRWNTLIFAFSSIASLYYFSNQNTTLGYSMAIVAITYPLVRTFEIYEAFLNGTKDFRTSALYRGVVDIGTIIATGITIFFTQNVIILVAANLSAQVILNYLFFKKIYQSIPPTEKENIEEGILNFSKHLSFQNILANLASQLDKILVFHYLGATEVAIYSFAIALPQQMRGFIANFSLLATPKISERSAIEAVRMIPHRFWTGLLILGPMVLLYIIFAPLLYQTFFPAYIESVKYSQIYILYFLLMGNISELVLTTQKAVKQKYILNTFSSISQIILMLALMGPFKIYGIIMAIVITKYITALLSYILVRQLPKQQIT